MIVHTEVLMKLNAGIDLYYFEALRRLIFVSPYDVPYFQGVFKMRDSIGISHSLPLAIREIVKTIKFDDYIGEYQTGGSLCETSDIACQNLVNNKQWKAFEMQGKKYVIVNESIELGTGNDITYRHIESNLGVFNAFNELFALAQDCKLNVSVLQSILKGEHVAVSEFQELHNAFALLELLTEIEICWENDGSTTKAIGSTFLPKFLYHLGVSLEIFPYGVCTEDINVSVFEKLVLLKFNGYFESVGLSLGIDVSYIVRSLIRFMKTEGYEAAAQDIKLVQNITKSPNLQKAGTSKSLMKYLRAFLSIFRSLSFTIRYKQTYGQLGYDFALGRPYGSARAGLYSHELQAAQL